jgi:transposase-like protein
MRFLGRLLGLKEERPVGGTKVSELECPHSALVPRWDRPDDMGKPKMVSSYLCEGCKANFSREEGDRLKAGEAERVRFEEP